MRILVAAFAFLAAASLAPAAEKPNIVFLLADDLGFGDLGVTGHPYVKTPTIDGLARDGTLFKNFYDSGATCCPSRTGLMTGRFPATFQKYPASYGFSGAVTVTDLLKKNGYKTGHFGKWHMGAGNDKPGTFGIDFVTQLKGNRTDPAGRDAEIATAAIDFIKANKAGPFYVNVWFHTPHFPVLPPKSYKEKFADVTVSRADFPNPDQQKHFDLYTKLGGNLDDGMRNFLGDVLQLDDQVARVLKAIDEQGLRNNTLVVFTSDNGPARCQDGKSPDLKVNMLGRAGPYRERKFSLYDGGIHQPMIVRWPDHVPAGRVDEKSVLTGVDYLPTLCTITGAAFDPTKFDGEDRSEVWLGKESDRKKDIFWNASNHRSDSVIRRGNWKLHEPPNVKKGEVELYDVSKDPGERENVAAKNPAVVKELSSAVTKWKAGLPTSYLKGAVDE